MLIKKVKKYIKKIFIFVIIIEMREFFFFCRDKMYKYILIFIVYMEFKDWFFIYKGEK